MIMKVEIIKEHLEHKVGDVVEVAIDRANYWIAVGVAKEYVAPKKKKKED
jgi:hypothetical protein